ncbi:hypothetical protein EV183_000777 [Coemansia sp. RSA 2336]|nr:hypothetical protein EV183_000777 [Coemansia sp. RSA 2336]
MEPSISPHLLAGAQFGADPIQLPANQPSETSPRFSDLVFKTFARARAAILNPPPAYARGAWAIINDVPYPPPPPYTGSRHPPTYDEAMEIGVIASPLRVEQQMQCRSRQSRGLPRVASAPQLTLLDEQMAGLPTYEDIEDTRLLSPVVQKWKLDDVCFMAFNRFLT